MPSDWMYLRGNGSQPHGYQMGGYSHRGDGGNYGPYATPSFVPDVPVENRDFPGPLMNGLEFQPMETCPKNFIIFDQTDNKSRVMFHPALAHNFSYPSFGIHPSFPHEIGKSLDSAIDNQSKLSSSMKEDTEEIDALLCSEEEEEEEEDDDVISTGHTPGNWRGSPRYSSSLTVGSTSQKTISSSSAQSSFSSSANSSGRKRERMRKMVKALRQIIPGGEQLDTPAVLDEAVRYLKSLKVEAKKLGIQNLEE